MNLRVVVLPLAVLAVAGGIALVGRGKAPVPAPVPAPHAPAAGGLPKGDYKPYRARIRVAPTTERISCTVRAPQPISVPPTVGLTPVETILVREGQAVKKGDVLLTFSPAPWQRSLAAAEKAGDRVKADAARRALASLEVRSPMDGIVYSLSARRGERPLEVDGQPSPVVVLFDWRLLTYEASASAALSEILAKNPQVFVETGKGRLVEAEIVVNGPAAADGSIPLVLRPRTAPPWVPEPGAKGEVAVVVGSHDAVVVPSEAIRTVGGRPTVWVVPVAGDPVPRTVVVGASLEGGMVEVSGLTTSESVAVWE
jgi:biotin carboxyl carrier protein